MSKKYDRPLSVRVRTVPPTEESGWKPKYEILMTDNHGNQTTMEGEEKDREIFQSERNIERNKVRRNRKSDEIRHHHLTVLGNVSKSAEDKYVKEEYEKRIREKMKRVLSRFERTDNARSVLICVVSGRTEWRDTQGIAEKLDISTSEVTAAKRKIKRCVKNTFPTLRKHLVRPLKPQGDLDGV